MADKKGIMNNLVGSWNRFLRKVDFVTTAMAVGLIVTTPFFLPIMPLTYCFMAVIVLSVNYLVNSLLISNTKYDEKNNAGKVTPLLSSPILNANIKPKPALIIQRKNEQEVPASETEKLPTRRGLFGMRS